MDASVAPQLRQQSLNSPRSHNLSFLTRWTSAVLILVSALGLALLGGAFLTNLNKATAQGDSRFANPKPSNPQARNSDLVSFGSGGSWPLETSSSPISPSETRSSGPGLANGQVLLRANAPSRQTPNPGLASAFAVSDGALAEEVQPAAEAEGEVSGNLMLSQAIDRLGSSSTVSARIRLRVEAFGVRLQGDGSYLKGQEGRMRFELKTWLSHNRKPAVLLQVCDGRAFWEYRDGPGSLPALRRSAVRVDYQAVLEARRQSPAWAAAPTLPGPGGLEELLRILAKDFLFSAPVVIQTEAIQSNQSPSAPQPIGNPDHLNSPAAGPQDALAAESLSVGAADAGSALASQAGRLVQPRGRAGQDGVANTAADQSQQVFQLVGRWTAQAAEKLTALRESPSNASAQAGPGQPFTGWSNPQPADLDLAQWPVHLPAKVEIWLRAEDLFPIAIRYTRPASSADPLSRRPMVLTAEFFEIALDRPIPPTSFRYRPAPGVAITDGTAAYLRRWHLSEDDE